LKKVLNLNMIKNIKKSIYKTILCVDKYNFYY
jgi:hypothetical protein